MGPSGLRTRRLLVAVGDASLAKVIRGNLDRHLVANRDLDEELPHLARDVGEHLVPVVQLDLVHGGRENLRDGSRNLNRLVIVFCHAEKFIKNRSETQVSSGAKKNAKKNAVIPASELHIINRGHG